MGPITKISLLVMMMYAASQVCCSLNSYKILGGCQKRYRPDDVSYFGEPKSGASPGAIVNKWGRNCRDVGADADPNVAEIVVGRAYTVSWYRYQYLVVSTRNNTDEEHYEFRGSYLVVRNAYVPIVEDIRFKNGITHAEPPMVDIEVFTGHAWMGTDTWKLAYLHFIMEPGVTRAPLTDAFSYIPVWKENPSVEQYEQFVGEWLSTSQRQQISDFRCYSFTWEGDNTICNQYIWKARTSVVDYNYDISNAKTNPSSLVFEDTIDGIILENYGFGVSSSDLARIGTTETITTQSRARFTSDYSVKVDKYLEEIKVNSRIRKRSWNGKKLKKSSERYEVDMSTSRLNVDTEFTFHQDLTKTSTVVNTKEITWPFECPPGIRKVVALIEKREEITTPVVFTLERAGSTWTETKDLQSTMSSLIVQSSECCLYEEASDKCGDHHLPMCDDSYAHNTTAIMVT